MRSWPARSLFQHKSRVLGPNMVSCAAAAVADIFVAPRCVQLQLLRGPLLTAWAVCCLCRRPRCMGSLSVCPPDWALNVPSPSFAEYINRDTWVVGFSHDGYVLTHIWLCTPVAAVAGTHPGYSWLWMTGSSSWPLLVGASEPNVVRALLARSNIAPPNLCV